MNNDDQCITEHDATGIEEVKTFQPPVVEMKFPPEKCSMVPDIHIVCKPLTLKLHIHDGKKTIEFSHHETHENGTKIQTRIFNQHGHLRTSETTTKKGVIWNLPFKGFIIRRMGNTIECHQVVKTDETHVYTTPRAMLTILDGCDKGALAQIIKQ